MFLWHRSARHATAMTVGLLLIGAPAGAQVVEGPLAAQTGGTIVGIALDRVTGQPIPGAVVRIEALRAQAGTDDRGEFVMARLSPGVHELRCEAPGYRRMVLTGIPVATGQTTRIVIDLEPEPIRHEERVEVVGRLPQRAEDQPVGGVTLSGRQVAAGAGGMGDFGRLLRATPAAGGVSDERNTIIARGGNPLENGFFVDNIELPNISHLPDFGSTGGIYSLIDPSTVREFDFIVGGFPVDHGERLSSITEITFREGSRDRVSGHVQFDIAMGAAGAEGPLPGGRGSWLASVRHADFVVLDDMIDWAGAQPQWTDAHLKLVYDVAPRHTLSLLGVYSGDRNVEDQGGGQTNHHRLSQTTIGINWLAAWAGRLRSETSVSHSQATWRHGQSYAPPYDVYDWYDDRKSEWVAVRNRNWLALGNDNRIEFGVHARHRSQYFDYVIKDPTAPGVDIAGPTEWTYETTEAATFGAATVTLLGRLTATAGARLDYSSASRRSHVSPRVAASLRLRSNLHLNGAAGLVYQPLPAEFLAVHPKFLALRDMRAAHYGLGLTLTGRQGWRATLEAYDKEYSALPIDPAYAHRLILDKEPFRSYTIPNELTDGGTGFARGVELLVEKRVADRFLGVIVARVSRDRYRDLRGVERNRLYDSRYGFTGTASYTPTRKWLFSGGLVVQGGTPYTPTDEALSRQYGIWIRQGGRYNAARYPAYVSLNLRAERSFAVGRATISVYADVWNVLGRENIGWIDGWDPVFGDSYDEQMPRTPFIGAAFRF